MLRSVIVASLVMLGAGPVPETAADATHARTPCRRSCAYAAAIRPAGPDMMSEGVARMAVRAAVPADRATRLSDRDKLELLVLFSLRTKTQAQ